MKKIIQENLYINKSYIFAIKTLMILLRPIKLFLQILRKLKLFRLVSFYLLESRKLHLHEIEGMTFIINSSDYVNSKKIYVNNKFPQFEEFNKAMELLQNEKIKVNSLIDVGSHYGNIVIPAVKKFKLEKAYAFEPVESNYNILNSNIKLNSLDKIIISKKRFLSDEVSKKDIQIFSNNSAASSNLSNLDKKHVKLYSSANNLKIDFIESLQSTILESEVDTELINNPFYWIYAQGYEYKIINGSKNLFNGSPPVVIAYSPLLNKNNNTDSSSFTKLMVELGYKNLIDLQSKTFENIKLYEEYLYYLDKKLLNLSRIRLLLFF